LGKRHHHKSKKRSREHKDQKKAESNNSKTKTQKTEAWQSYYPYPYSHYETRTSEKEALVFDADIKAFKRGEVDPKNFKKLIIKVTERVKVENPNKNQNSSNQAVNTGTGTGTGTKKQRRAQRLPSKQDKDWFKEELNKYPRHMIRCYICKAFTIIAYNEEFTKNTLTDHLRGYHQIYNKAHIEDLIDLSIAHSIPKSLRTTP